MELEWLKEVSYWRTAPGNSSECYEVFEGKTMGRPDDVSEKIKKSYSPQNISDYYGINYNSVVDYLYRAIGHNKIRMSDIVFTWPEPSRNIIENIIEKLNTTYWYSIYNDYEFKRTVLNRNDLQFYLELRRYYIGDLYYMISNLEIFLHNTVKNEMMKYYNNYEDEWWEKGVSTNIRQKCSNIRKKYNEHNLPLWHFLTFSQLAIIIKNNWNVFNRIFTNDIIEKSEKLKKYLFKINEIRNKIMHPLNSGVIRSDNEFLIVRKVYDIMIKIDIKKTS